MGQYARERSLLSVVLPALVLAAIAGSIALRKDALQATLLADDYDHYAMFEGIYPVARGPLNAYDFVANADERAVLMAYGRLPWWTDQDLQLSVLRPLSSILSWADYAVLGTSWRAHRVHSFVWFGLFVAAAALWFRQLLPLSAACVAVVLFTLEEGHALPVVWVANRNALVALSFGTLALWSYLRERRGRALAGRWFPPALLALGLAGGEHALPLLGYFVAYECFAASDTARDRARALWPVAAVAVGYLSLRWLLGHGLAGSGFYVSPAGTPLRFLAALGERLPLLLADLVLGIGAEWHFSGLPWASDLVDLGLLPASALSLTHWAATQRFVALGCTALVALVLCSRRALSALAPVDCNHRFTRFLLGGAVLSLVPACSAMPMSRLTLAGALGIDLLLASALVRASTSAYTHARNTRVARALPPLLLACLIVAIHGVHAGRRTQLDVQYYTVRSHLESKGVLHAELDDARVAQQHVLVIAARDWASQWALPFARHALGLRMPEATYLLSGASTNAHVLTRVDASTFDLTVVGFQPEGGFLGSVYRPAESPFRVGDAVVMPMLRARVMETNRGRPTRVRFDLGTPLHPTRHVFLYPMRDGMRRVEPPAVGEALRLPPPSNPTADTQ